MDNFNKQIYNTIMSQISHIVKTTLNESYGDDDNYPAYYEFCEEYDIYYVLDQFFYEKKPKEDWGTLIDPNMYKKALEEFTKYGQFMRFPTDYIYKWMKIIMKNTAILRANTELAGHTSTNPDYEIQDFCDNHDIEIPEEYEDDLSEWLDSLDFYDWMQAPDGTDAWSDFGLEPIEKILIEYKNDMSPEKVIVLINRVLDVYHCRGDLSSLFIHGGSKSLSEISESVQIIKSNILNESQIDLLQDKSVLENPEFLEWFSDSECTEDDNKTPMLVFYGGDRGETNHYWFSDSNIVAKYFGEDNRHRFRKTKFHKAFLKMQNPLIVDWEYDSWSFHYYDDDNIVDTEDMANIAEQQGYDGLIIHNIYEGENENYLCDDYIVFNKDQIYFI